MKLEHKHFALAVKAEGDSGAIEGYGSVYGNVDGGRDIVLPGAFAKSLAGMKAANRNCKMLWQHKTDVPIGVYDEITEDASGLRVKGRLLLDTQMGREAYALLKAGAIDGLSIGYGVKDYSIDSKSGVRLLKELELYEVSLVTFPMNDKATVTSVKSASDDIDTAVTLLQQAMAMCDTGSAGDVPMSAEMCASCCQLISAAVSLLDDPNETPDMQDMEGMSKPVDERALEKYLCDAGLSRKRAKAFISGGFKAVTPRRDAEDYASITHILNQFKA